MDVLGLVLGRTDTPSLRRVFDAKGEPYGALAAPIDVAEEALDHLADGPHRLDLRQRQPDRRLTTWRAEPP